MNFRTRFLCATVLGTALVFAGGPIGADHSLLTADKAFAGNNGNGNSNGNGGNSSNAGNSGGRGNSGDQASSGKSGNKNNAGNSGNNAHAGNGGNNNSAGNGTVMSALGNLMNRGQAKKAALSSDPKGNRNAAKSKMTPKDIYAEYGFKPNEVPGGWMGALMGNMNLRASEKSVHGRAQTALAAYQAVGTASNAYQAALSAKAGDADLAALDPTSPTYDADVAALANSKISALDDAIAMLDETSPTYEDEKMTLEAEKADWQAVLDTQSAAQTAQGDFERAFEDVTKGKTPYSEPLAGQVMMIYQDKTDELSAENGG